MDSFLDKLYNKWKWIAKIEGLDCDIINVMKHVTYRVGIIRTFQAPTLSELQQDHQISSQLCVSYTNTDGIVYKLSKSGGTFWIKPFYGIMIYQNSPYFNYRQEFYDDEFMIWSVDYEASGMNAENLVIHSTYGYGLFTCY